VGGNKIQDMKQKNIRGIIQEINLRKLLYPFLTLIITVLIFIRLPFYEVWNPAKILMTEQIIAFYNEERYYVDITWAILYYSGYDYLENGKWKGSYYYTLSDELCYFVLLSPELTEEKAEMLKQVHIKAKLVSGGKMLTELIKGMATDLGWTAQGLSAATSHIVVSEVDYVLARSNVLFAINTLLMVIAAFTTSKLLIFIFQPVCYPACSRMRCYGAIRSHIRQLDKELNEKNLIYGDLTITRNYLISISKYEIQMIPLKDIIWAYKYSTFRRYRRQRITYTLRVVGRKGVTVITPGQKKEDVDRVLAVLKEGIPEVKIGYKREYERMVKNRNEQRKKKNK